MNIGLVNEYFPPFAPGGAEWSTLYLARGLAERGHQVTVLTPNYGTLPTWEDADGFLTYRFPCPIKYRTGALARTPNLGNPLFYAWSAWYVAQAGKAKDLAILHAQNKYSMPGTWLAARALGLPVLVTIRDVGPLCPFAVCVQQSDTVPADCDLLSKYISCAGLFYEQYIGGRSLIRRARFALNSALFQRLDLALRRSILARTDRAIFISEGIRAIYLSAPHSKLPDNLVIYNVPPLPSEHASFSWEGRRRIAELRGHPIVLYVGKQSPGKGTPDLMAAIPKVIEEVPDVMFLFVGRGDAEGQVGPEVRAHVAQWDPLPNPDVLALMGEVRLVVLPSATPEAQGRVLLEAMSVGIPSVATRVGGIPETVADGETGLLVDRHDVAGLASAIVHMLRDPYLSERMGRRGRQMLLQRFDPARSLDQLEAVYCELATERR